MESATFLKKAGTTMKALCEWLQSQGYLEGEEAALATKRSSNAAKNLPKAEKAGRLLWEQAQATRRMFGSNKLDESAYMDITKIQPGKLWVTPIGFLRLHLSSPQQSCNYKQSKLLRAIAMLSLTMIFGIEL
jgi:hypothetical protein